MSAIWSGLISLRLSPRDLRIFTQESRASMSWTLPWRSGRLRFVSTQKYVEIPVL